MLQVYLICPTFLILQFMDKIMLVTNPLIISVIILYFILELRHLRKYIQEAYFNIILYLKIKIKNKNPA